MNQHDDDSLKIKKKSTGKHRGFYWFFLWFSLFFLLMQIPLIESCQSLWWTNWCQQLQATSWYLLIALPCLLGFNKLNFKALLEEFDERESCWPALQVLINKLWCTKLINNDFTSRWVPRFLHSDCSSFYLNPETKSSCALVFFWRMYYF